MISTKPLVPSIAAAVATAVLLSACAGYGGAPATANSGRRAEDVLAQRYAPSTARAPRHQDALREGIKLYDEGDFNGAIRRLAAVDVPGESTANRLTALKYTAFSYCVTARPVPCRQAFDKAFLLDPGFDLAAGEHSHPLWGPVFAKAKRER